MTKEEAAKEIEAEFNEFLKGTGLDNEEYLKSAMETNEDLRKVVEANRMAIKALEQQPCEDCIKREFVEILVNYLPADLCIYPEYKGKPYYSILYRGEDGRNHVGFGTYKIEMLSQWIKQYFMSDNQPKPKTGHWIVNEWGNISCSECGCTALYDKVYPSESAFGKAIRVKSTFCPTCGAKMLSTDSESEE